MDIEKSLLQYMICTFNYNTFTKLMSLIDEYSDEKYTELNNYINDNKNSIPEIEKLVCKDILNSVTALSTVESTSPEVSNDVSRIHSGVAYIDFCPFITGCDMDRFKPIYDKLYGFMLLTGKIRKHDISMSLLDLNDEELEHVIFTFMFLLWFKEYFCKHILIDRFFINLWNNKLIEYFNKANDLSRAESYQDMYRTYMGDICWNSNINPLNSDNIRKKNVENFITTHIPYSLENLTVVGSLIIPKNDNIFKSNEVQRNSTDFNHDDNNIQEAGEMTVNTTLGDVVGCPPVELAQDMDEGTTINQQELVSDDVSLTDIESDIQHMLDTDDLFGLYFIKQLLLHIIYSKNVTYGDYNKVNALLIKVNKVLDKSVQSYDFIEDFRKSKYGDRCKSLCSDKYKIVH